MKNAPTMVIAQSNGHSWIEFKGLVCCRDCGFIRNAKDDNKPCRGQVRVGPRATHTSGVRGTND